MIYIIRHGKTALNKANVLQGRSDCPLNEEGILQAKEAAGKLKNITFSHVYSSPLSRAIQTAELVAPGQEIIIDKRLIEMDYGPYEGIDLTHLPPEILRFFSDFINNPAPDGMEQLPEVIKRAGSFLEEIKGQTGNLLISTHAIAMKGLLEYLTPESHGSYWSKYIGNCAIYTAENVNGHISVPVELDTGTHPLPNSAR